MFINHKGVKLKIYVPNEREKIKEQINKLLEEHDGLLEELLLEIRENKIKKIKNNLK